MRGLSNDLWSMKPIALPVMVITAPSQVNVYLWTFEERGLKELKFNSMLMTGRDRIKTLRPGGDVTLLQKHWCRKWGLSWPLILWALTPWNLEQVLRSYLLSICATDSGSVLFLPHTTVNTHCDDSLAEAQRPPAAVFPLILRLVIAQSIVFQHDPSVLPSMYVVRPL